MLASLSVMLAKGSAGASSGIANGSPGERLTGFGSSPSGSVAAETFSSRTVLVLDCVDCWLAGREGEREVANAPCRIAGIGSVPEGPPDNCMASAYTRRSIELSTNAFTGSELGAQDTVVPVLSHCVHEAARWVKEGSD